MTKRVSKRIVIATIVVMAITAMTVSISAFKQYKRYWSIIIGTTSDSVTDYVPLLREGEDFGLDFYVTTYYNGGNTAFMARASLVDQRLTNTAYVDLTGETLGTYKRIYFVSDWYALSGGTVDFHIYALNYDKSLSGQYIGGYVE